MLTRKDFSYQLDADLIAQSPALVRDHSRLLTVSRTTGNIQHMQFSDLPSVLKPGDCLVRNNTKVFPARLFGHKTTGGRVEIFLLEQLADSGSSCTWICLTKPGLTPNHRVTLEHSNITATLDTKTAGHETTRTIATKDKHLRFSVSAAKLLNYAQKHGHTPLPPYITSSTPESQLALQYQTEYARVLGSAAAPTAGLHFTRELDEKLKNRGIEFVDVTLHVGLGTFAPVTEDDVRQHQIHHEWYQISPEAVQHITAAKQAGRRVVAVGTTSVRVLEGNVKQFGQLRAFAGQTDIFILPPFKFTVVDAMITNFHLPHSTLLMLSSAFCSYPNTSEKFSSFSSSLMGKAYQIATQQKYRFFSFGDAMLIE